MKCPKCDSELIWGGDHDDEDQEGFIMTNYGCNSCDTTVFVNWSIFNDE